MDLLTLFLLAVCVLLVVLPPELDPAIWLKEWTDKDETHNNK